MFCLLSYHCVTFEKTLTVSGLCPTLKQQKTAVRSPFTLLLLRLKSPNSLSCPSLDMLQSASGLFVQGSPRLCSTPDGCHKCRIKKKDGCPRPPGCSPANATQGEVLCCQGTQLAQFTTILKLKSSKKYM